VQTATRRHDWRSRWMAPPRRHATLATIAYMLSRGFAKSGSRSRAWDPREDLDTDRRD